MSEAVLAVDSSAIVAILAGESEEQQFLEALDRHQCVIGVPTVLEIEIWRIRRHLPTKMRWLHGWLHQSRTRLAPFDRELLVAATQAYDRFGKGRHPARLNFGDCMSYAVARTFDAPLLFKGADFGQTDLALHPASISI